MYTFTSDNLKGSYSYHESILKEKWSAWKLKVTDSYDVKEFRWDEAQLSERLVGWLGLAAGILSYRVSIRDEYKSGLA